MSLSEASRILKTPETTLRRMAVEGKIVAEREPRAPGDTRTVWRIRVDDPPDDPPLDPPPSATPEEDQPPIASESAPALSERLLQTVLTQAEQIGELRERAARAEATAETLRERVTDLAQMAAERQAELEELRGHLAEEAARLRAEAARRRWWRFWG